MTFLTFMFNVDFRCKCLPGSSSGAAGGCRKRKEVEDKRRAERKRKRRNRPPTEPGQLPRLIPQSVMADWKTNTHDNAWVCIKWEVSLTQTNMSLDVREHSGCLCLVSWFEGSDMHTNACMHAEVGWHGVLWSKGANSPLWPKRNSQAVGVNPRRCTGEDEQIPTQLGRITSGDYTHRGDANHDGCVDACRCAGQCASIVKLLCVQLCIHNARTSATRCPTMAC